MQGNRRLHFVSGIVTSILLASGSCAQFRPESAEDCLDWYAAVYDSLSNDASYSGRARMSGSGSEGFVVIEWFESRFMDPNTSIFNMYSEARNSYAGGEHANTWEKILSRGDEFFYSHGSYSRKLKSEKTGLLDDKGKLRDDKGKEVDGVAPVIRKPNPWSLTILSNAAFTTSRDNQTFFREYLNSLKILDEKETDKGFVGFFYCSGSGIEIEFEREFQWMPTHVKGYYRNNIGAKTADRSNFTQLQYEVATTWKEFSRDADTEKPDSDRNKKFFPAEIFNDLHSINPKSKDGQEMLLNCNWQVGGLTSDFFTNESIQSAGNAIGPMADLRKRLTTEHPSSSRFDKN